MNDPEITRKSPGNHPVITPFSRLITSTLLLLFTFAIGNVWGATETVNKTVTLEREGVVTNIINRLVSGSTWLTLRPGENKFYVRASEGLSKLKVRLIHRNAYLGV